MNRPRPFVLHDPLPRVVVPIAEPGPERIPEAMAEGFRQAVARFGPEADAPDRYHVVLVDDVVPDTPEVQIALDRGREALDAAARALRPGAIEDWGKTLRWEASYGPPPLADGRPPSLTEPAPEALPDEADADLEELFGEGGGTPTPRTRLVIGLLGGGLLAAVLGMACTAAPGGILVLFAWVVVEKELDRVESGYLSTEFRPRLQALQRWVYAGVLGVVVLFVLQLWLLCNGTYEALWGAFLMLLFGEPG